MAKKKSFWVGRVPNTDRKEIVVDRGVPYVNSTASTFWVSATGQEILRRMEAENPSSTIQIREKFLVG